MISWSSAHIGFSINGFLRRSPLIIIQSSYSFMPASLSSNSRSSSSPQHAPSYASFDSSDFLLRMLSGVVLLSLLSVFSTSDYDCERLLECLLWWVYSSVCSSSCLAFLMCSSPLSLVAVYQFSMTS